MNEIYEKLFTTKKLCSKYYIDAINDEEQLIIRLSDEYRKKMLTLIWNGIVEAYMCSEESSRTLLYTNEVLTMWTFFEVNNSSFLKWLEKTSCGIIQLKDYHHICIVGINSVVDIVSVDYPQVIEEVYTEKSSI